MSELPRVSLNTTIAKNMKKARMAQGITQSELAKRTKVPRARIKRIECLELDTLDEGEYGRLLRALNLMKPAVKKSTKKMRARAARAVLEKHGLLDVTLGEILRS